MTASAAVSSMPLSSRSLRVCSALFASLGGLLALLCPQVAQAQRTLVLTMGGDAPADVSAQARAVIVSALEAEGIALVPEGDLAARVSPARVRAVASLDDVRAIAFELEARAAVVSTVWLAEEGEPAPPASVVVTVLHGARSFTATVAVADEGLAAATQAALAQARAEQTQAALVGGAVGDEPLRPEGVADPSRVRPATAAEEAAARRESQDQIFEIAGPTMLGAFGAAGVGMGVYALLDATCERLAPISEVCLRGDAPNTPAGVVLVIAGVLAMAGAVVWFAVGAQPVEVAPIDLVLQPGGGELRVRGRF